MENKPLEISQEEQEKADKKNNEATEITAEWESKTGKNPFHLTGMVLAYIGDAVYELEIRNLLIARGYFRGNRLHKEATRRVNAPTQSRLVLSMLDSLEPDELEIFKRGRNTKPKYIPKQSNVTEYTNSSGLEALMGYWYLQGNTGRIRETIERLEEMLAEK